MRADDFTARPKETVCIKNLDKVEVLKALWDAAEVALPQFYKPINVEEMGRIVENTIHARRGLYFAICAGNA